MRLSASHYLQKHQVGRTLQWNLQNNIATFTKSWQAVGQMRDAPNLSVLETYRRVLPFERMFGRTGNDQVSLLSKHYTGQGAAPYTSAGEYPVDLKKRTSTAAELARETERIQTSTRERTPQGITRRQQRRNYLRLQTLRSF